MSTQRWVLTEVDTGDTWTMPINPDSMTSPFLDRQIATTHGTHATAASERIRSFRTPSRAKEWQFGGAIRTQVHDETLAAWAKKPGRIHVTDHLGRTFECLLTSYEPTERKPTKRNDWLLRYTMKALVLRRIS